MLKKRSRYSLVLTITAAFLANPAHAQQSADFSVQGDDFSVEIPDGFCLPTGDDAEKARRSAAVDSQNVTPIDVQKCGSFGKNYTLIKSPRGFARVAEPRNEFLARLQKELTPQSVQMGIEIGKSDVARSTGGQVDVSTDSYQFIGSDDLCVFLAGSLDVAIAGRDTLKPRGATCVTVVGGRMFAVHSYDFDPNGTSTEQLKARSRTVAASIKSK